MLGLTSVACLQRAQLSRAMRGFRTDECGRRAPSGSFQNTRPAAVKQVKCTKQLERRRTLCFLGESVPRNNRTFLEILTQEPVSHNWHLGYAESILLLQQETTNRGRVDESNRLCVCVKSTELTL